MTERASLAIDRNFQMPESQISLRNDKYIVLKMQHDYSSDIST